MILTPNQIEELLEIIDRNQVIALTKELGPDFLSEKDKRLLTKHGIEWDELYELQNDAISTSFHFGMLAEALEAVDVRKMSYNHLKSYIKSGKYIPLTIREKAAIQSVKNQTFNDLKSLNGRIFKDVNQELLNHTLKGQRQFLQDEVISGVENKKINREIVNQIAKKTGDWSRDFDRIITFATTQAFEEGKAAMIKQYSGEEDPLVYKLPMDGACKHCIRLYLTNGVGSQPIIFKLSQLRANGTNIGRKTDEWRATLGGVHPYCRCPLYHYKRGSIWNIKKQDWIEPDRSSGNKNEPVGPKDRPRVRIWVGDKEYWV